MYGRDDPMHDANGDPLILAYEETKMVPVLPPPTLKSVLESDGEREIR